jgi:tripartite-type tricarboxylate transporter receptor subunit TctC
VWTRAMHCLRIVQVAKEPQISTVADLVTFAKRTPGKLNYGSAGAGTPGHLTGEIFKAAPASTSSTWRTGAARRRRTGAARRR